MGAPLLDHLQDELDLEEDAVAAPWTLVDDRLSRWRARFGGVFALVAGRFARAGSRRRTRLYLLEPLSGAERKNSWTWPSRPVT
jgi:hypothetical protein